MRTIPLPTTPTEEYDLSYYNVNAAEDVILSGQRAWRFPPSPSPDGTHSDACGRHQHNHPSPSLLFEGSTFLPSITDDCTAFHAPRNAHEVYATEARERSTVTRTSSEHRRTYVDTRPASQYAASPLARETRGTAHPRPHARGMPATRSRPTQSQRRARPVSTPAVVDRDCSSEDEDEPAVETSGLATTVDWDSDAESLYGPPTPAHVTSPLDPPTHKGMPPLHRWLDSPYPAERRVLSRDRALEALPLPGVAIPFAQEQGKGGMPEGRVQPWLERRVRPYEGGPSWRGSSRK